MMGGFPGKEYEETFYYSSSQNSVISDKVLRNRVTGGA
jgi:hypothetical protein